MFQALIRRPKATKKSSSNRDPELKMLRLVSTSDASIQLRCNKDTYSSHRITLASMTLLKIRHTGYNTVIASTAGLSIFSLG